MVKNGAFCMTELPINQNNFPPIQITFGMIVLNGEPFTRYNLRSIYRWAHQIIVIEGACVAASAVASADGHSTDNTLEILLNFQKEEDPEKKLVIVTAEDEGHPNGFWPGEKNEMSQAYTKRATGNFIWQVDVDEFYLEKDIPTIIRKLQEGADTITFPTIHFWGGCEYVEDGEYMRINKGRESHRIFRWGPGYNYLTHRPTTITDENCISLRTRKWIGALELEREKIFMYHYSMLLPKQVQDKCSYYANVDWASFQKIQHWAEESYFKLKTPFNVCNSLHTPLSWLERYDGEHPSEVLQMVNNIHGGFHPSIELRRTDDINIIISSLQYQLGRIARKLWVHAIPTYNRLFAITIRTAKVLPYHAILRRWYYKLLSGSN